MIQTDRLRRLASAVVVTVTVLAAPARAGELPNLIVFLADDQGIDAVQGPAVWSNELACHTPNLAKLAAKGTVFTHARVDPFCSPTRAGLLTGRPAIWTGVSHLVAVTGGRKDSELLALAGSERTWAEMLQELGYYTVFVDKWHVGNSAQLGQTPGLQGFDVAFDVLDHLHLDAPDAVGDEHVTRMVDLALDAVQNRPDPGQPYALFYSSLDPHARWLDDDGLLWWSVDPALAPQTHAEGEPVTNRDRYRAVVEAQDTELARLLTTLGITDGQLDYVEESDTVCFFLGDNGTPSNVALDPSHAKGSLYEGGVRVPFLVFGEHVPAGVEHPRLVSHMDLYETLADVVGASPLERGPAPRTSYTFAAQIGWPTPGPGVDRPYTLSSLRGSQAPMHKVALADASYKLVADAGGPGLAPMGADRFYDLVADPGEAVDLVEQGMDALQLAAYRQMRAALPTHWGTAVGVPIEADGLYQVDVPATAIVLVGEGAPPAWGAPAVVFLGHLPHGNETRLFLQFDLDGVEAELPPGLDFGQLDTAQLVVAFGRDVYGGRDADTGPVEVRLVTESWAGLPPGTVDLFDAVAPFELGRFDFAPRIRLPGEQAGHPGLPMQQGTPVSFGARRPLREAVQAWHADPQQNRGLALVAESLGTLLGDERVGLMQEALLRLTFVP